MQDTKILNLRKPVTLGEVEYKTLDLREPTAGELERAASANSSVGAVIELTSVIAKVPRRVAEGICQRDFLEASDFFSTFSASSVEPIGETSSPT